MTSGFDRASDLTAIYMIESNQQKPSDYGVSLSIRAK